ncbi:MAG: insulinase family protein [Holophagaceae bacterium]|nr:insulinase family protein [Holophagaceae bacterium]
MSQSLAVSEFHLENGVKVLLSPRPGSGAIHAAWFIDGVRGDSGPRQPGSADLMLAAWFSDPNIRDASGFWIMTSSSGISHGRDILAGGLKNWCDTELSRFTQIIEPEQVLQGIEFLRAQWEKPDPMQELLTMALEGSEHAPPERRDVNGLSSVSVADIQALAEKYIVPKRITIILVGDVDESSTNRALETSFGQLPPGAIPLATIEGNPSKAFFEPPPQERRQVEIPSRTKTEVLIAWRVPPLQQKLWPTLNLFAEILAGSQDSRLVRHLVTDLGFSNEVKVYNSFLAREAGGVFVIQADVADGHSVHEVESSVQNEIARSFEEGLEFVEINRAINSMDVKQARRLANASRLAQAMADAIGGSGEWVQAIRQASHGTDLDPGNIKKLLHPIFIDGSTYSLSTVRDPILWPRSQDHARLIWLLKQLQKKRGIDGLRGEEAIKEALRQFGQMPKGKQGEMLSLLELEAGR